MFVSPVCLAAAYWASATLFWVCVSCTPFLASWNASFTLLRTSWAASLAAFFMSWAASEAWPLAYCLSISFMGELLSKGKRCT